MTESLEQAKAFDYYYTLGKDRNLKKVAKHVKKSIATVKNWSRQNKWPDRVEERDTKNATALMEKTDETLLSTKEEYRELIKKAVEKYFQDFLKGKLAVKNIQDFERLVKLDLQLMGDNPGNVITVQVVNERENLYFEIVTEAIRSEADPATADRIIGHIQRRCASLSAPQRIGPAQ